MPLWKSRSRAPVPTSRIGADTWRKGRKLDEFREGKQELLQDCCSIKLELVTLSSDAE